jgi:hypothetical protein
MREPAHEFFSPFLAKRLAAVVFSALLLAFMAACGGGVTTPPTPTAPATFTLQLQPPNPVLTVAQRTALGFKDGPPDGMLGVLLNNGTYSFYGSALSSTTCSGTPGVQVFHAIADRE